MENETSREFLRRTDTLAVQKGINLGELPDLLGISRASFFAYRGGQRPITSKAWRKLEQIEKGGTVVRQELAGMVQQMISTATVCEDPAPYGTLEMRVRSAEAKLGHIKTVLETLLRDFF